MPAACAVLLLLVGQIVALAHAAETRHVTCGEHGEELEAAKLAGAVDQCEHDHWIAVEGDEGGEHEDCAIARALHQSSATPQHVSAPALTTVVVAHAFVAHEVAAAATDLYLIAPKTSPPA